MISSYLPLTTYEEAVLLRTKMVEQDILKNEFYSSKLVDALLVDTEQ